jgi:pyridinium-3,5-bisthiocarboxylic acid mononucleotide nickel chelatase
MALHWHIDCASGAAGDMLLGAMLDLGASRAVVDDALRAIGFAPECLTATRCMRGSMAALDVKVRTDLGVPPTWHDAAHDHSHDASHEHSHDASHEHSHDASHEHSHDASHEHSHDASHDHSHDHSHYHYQTIRAHLVASTLRGDIRDLALDIFDRLASAEAELHGTTTEQVNFHEVGAIDSVVDIVGCAAAFCSLSPTSVSCSAVAMGTGTLRCAHGMLPVPAPAALAIMRNAGALIAGGGIARELCTPTGAAVLSAIVKTWGDFSAGRVTATGWGAGDADLGDRPNVVRITAMHITEASQSMWCIEANIDDMNSQLCDVASAAMFAAGAVDVWWTPIVMKKSRPALLCSALADDQHRAAVVAALLAETTTIGVRFSPVQRTVLQRSWLPVQTEFGTVRIKLGHLDGQLVNAAPEFDDCVAAAQRNNVATKIVLASAIAAYALAKA